MFGFFKKCPPSTEEEKIEGNIIKYSVTTAKINPKLIITGYESLINEKREEVSRELEKLNKEVHFQIEREKISKDKEEANYRIGFERTGFGDALFIEKGKLIITKKELSLLLKGDVVARAIADISAINDRIDKINEQIDKIKEEKNEFYNIYVKK